MMWFILVLSIFHFGYAGPAVQGPPFSWPQSTSRYNGLCEEEVGYFLRLLKQAIYKDDPKMLWALIDYRMRTEGAGWYPVDAYEQYQRNTDLKDSPELKRHYIEEKAYEFFLQYRHKLFTPHICNGILRTIPQSLMVNSHGFGMHEGEIWFEGCTEHDYESDPDNLKTTLRIRIIHRNPSLCKGLTRSCSG